MSLIWAPMPSKLRQEKTGERKEMNSIELYYAKITFFRCKYCSTNKEVPKDQLLQHLKEKHPLIYLTYMGANQ